MKHRVVGTKMLFFIVVFRWCEENSFKATRKKKELNLYYAEGTREVAKENNDLHQMEQMHFIRTKKM